MDSVGTHESKIRCECGRLLFKSTRNGLELKCHRCKRMFIITWQELNRSIAKNQFYKLNDQISPET